MVDAWQLCFLSAALFLFTGSTKQRRFAGLPLAAATLTKLLPALLLVYLCVRSWRAGPGGLLRVGALPKVGQGLYGPFMGVGHPFSVRPRRGGHLRPLARHLGHTPNR